MKTRMRIKKNANKLGLYYLKVLSLYQFIDIAFFLLHVAIHYKNESRLKLQI